MDTYKPTHLKQLEAESIHIIREVAAEFEKPVMLYSIGKDSAVMLHLAMKAFYPGKPPFPLLHVDTTWKFREMIRFRDEQVRRLGLELIVYVNEEGVRQGINPFTHGSRVHTDVMKTQALKQALDRYGFDAAFGGARRDEERSRAKERVYSFRDRNHRWDPKNQRPELWNLFNGRVHRGESIRVFPLSNWTELDVWQYIHLERIPIVPLYLAAERPVVAPPVSERPLPASGRFVGPEVEFGPGAVALAEPATLTLPVDAARVDASGSDLRLVKVWRVGPDGWEIQAPAAEARDGQVQATVEALTRFGAGVEVP